MNENLEFKVLKGKEITEELFDVFYEFLSESFLKVEFRSYEAQKRLLKKDSYQILFCFIGDKIVGVMALWNLEDFWFIEHFAVTTALRNKGIGKKMLDFVKLSFEKYVILEVELPYNEMNKKRIGFYQRNGFLYNDYEYYQHPLNKGDKPLPLRIMSFPNEINKEQFDKVAETLKVNVYNA